MPLLSSLQGKTFGGVDNEEGKNYGDVQTSLSMVESDLNEAKKSLKP